MTIRKLNRNIKSARLERFQKSRKVESVADDSHNLWYSFATDIESMLEEQGVYCDIWINDMGFMEISNENGDTCAIYTKVVPDGRFMSQQLMIEQEDGSFKAGEVFDTGEQPNAKKILYDLAWLEPHDADECNRKTRRPRRKSVR
jgi:hypothetical protein